MKLVALLAQDSQSVNKLKRLIAKAEIDNINYCFLDGELITVEQAHAMIKLIVLHNKNEREIDDTLHIKSNEHSIRDN